MPKCVRERLRALCGACRSVVSVRKGEKRRNGGLTTLEGSELQANWLEINEYEFEDVCGRGEGRGDACGAYEKI